MPKEQAVDVDTGNGDTQQHLLSRSATSQDSQKKGAGDTGQELRDETAVPAHDDNCNSNRGMMTTTEPSFPCGTSMR
eukprot:GSA25T00009115001.1